MLRTHHGSHSRTHSLTPFTIQMTPRARKLAPALVCEHVGLVRMFVGVFVCSLFVCACLFLCVYMSLVCGGIGVWGVCLSSGRFVRTHLF